MKNPKSLLLVVAIAAPVIVALALRSSNVEVNMTTSMPARATPIPAAAGGPARSAPGAFVARSAGSAPRISSTDSAVRLPEVHAEGVEAVHVRSDQVLARINSTAIQLRDLVPLAEGETERTMTREEYDSRLNRAMETELVLQAVAARGLDLTAEQKARLQRIAQEHKATMEEYKQQGLTWNSVTAAQIEFETRLTSALMYLQNLVRQEAKVAPSVDPQMQARFEQARRELLSRLKANATISTGGPPPNAAAIPLRQVARYL